MSDAFASIMRGLRDARTCKKSLHVGGGEMKAIVWRSQYGGMKNHAWRKSEQWYTTLCGCVSNYIEDTVEGAELPKCKTCERLLRAIEGEK